VKNCDRGAPAPEGVGFCVLYPEEGRSLDLRRDSYKKKIKAHGVLAADVTITTKSMIVSRAKIPNENRVKSCPATRHVGAWGRGGIAPTHSRPWH
jgi:hypothetical protein